jgi:hypothetical protein
VALRGAQRLPGHLSRARQPISRAPAARAVSRHVRRSEGASGVAGCGDTARATDKRVNVTHPYINGLETRKFLSVAKQAVRLDSGVSGYVSGGRTPCILNIARAARTAVPWGCRANRHRLTQKGQGETAAEVTLFSIRTMDKDRRHSCIPRSPLCMLGQNQPHFLKLRLDTHCRIFLPAFSVV